MNYDIYGVGNALVDLEFEVSDADLRELQVDKGLMTLIDKIRYEQLIGNLQGLQHAKASGGSGANSIITAQLLGAATFYSCRVANDELGDFYYEDLRSKGVATNLDENNRAPGVTGKCIVMLTPDAERSMNTYLGISESLSTNELREQAIRASKFIYSEGYLVAVDSTFQTALTAHQLGKQHQVKCVTTFSDPNMVTYFKQQLLTLLAEPVDLLFCNEKEALLFCDTEDLEVVKQTLPHYAKTFAVTLGAKGSIAFDGHTFHYCDAMPTTVIDTLGAGDTFAGAFMYGLTQGYSYQDANKIANIAAARIVAKFGPRIEPIDAQHILSSFNNNKVTN